MYVPKDVLSVITMAHTMKINNCNDLTYEHLLRDILAAGYYSDDDTELAGELVGHKVTFDVYGTLSSTDKRYAKAELEWYLSNKCNIANNDVIANTKIWKRISTPEGNVNSNYGWCVFSGENENQFDRALNAILESLTTKHCVMIYSRPSINKEWNDGHHAKSDMICTIYVAVNVRKNRAGDYEFDYNVHMRSCDALFGLRNDLYWHQFIADLFIDSIEKHHGISIASKRINWFADSIHIYKWAVNKVNNILEEV